MWLFKVTKFQLLLYSRVGGEVNITVEPCFNEPLYIKVLGIWNNIPIPSYSKIYEKNLNITNSSFSEHILSVPCRAVITGRGTGFAPATMNVAPGYFQWKIEEK